MKLKRILAVIWVVALFLLLIGGFVMQGTSIAWLQDIGVRIHPVYTQSE